jgi:hypothetical protein
MRDLFNTQCGVDDSHTFRKLSVLRSIAIPAAFRDLSRLAGVRSSDRYRSRSKSHIADDKNHIAQNALLGRILARCE